MMEESTPERRAAWVRSAGYQLIAAITDRGADLLIRARAKDLEMALEATESESALSGSVGGLNDAPPWQPIETALKDGAPIIVGAVGEKSMIGFWSQRRLLWLKYGAMVPTFIYPTHWMPLPASPVCAAEKK